MSEFEEAVRRASALPMTSATPKPRAGEHVPVGPFRWDNYDSVCRDAENWIVGWEEMMRVANALLAQQRELVEALASIDQLMMAMPLTSKIEHKVHGIAHRALSKVRP